MKRFILSILAVAVFCVGLGSLVERAGARFKSDEKALAIIRDARQAIGGETALIAVRSLVINGQTTRTLKIDGADKTVQGETEIAMQLPDKLMKMIKIGDGAGEKGEKMVQRHVDVVVVGDKAKEGDRQPASPEADEKIIIKKADGDGEKVILRKVEGDARQAEIEHAIATGNGEHVMIKRAGGPGHEAMRQNEMLRLTLSLLLTAPQALDVSYTYGGETDVDGTACNIVVAEAAGSSYKLFIGKSSNLPVAMTFKSVKMPAIMMFRTKAPESGEPKGDVVFTRKVDVPPMETVEFTVKFSDFRSVGGLQLPFKWTQTIGGVTDEVFDVASYDVNPANIADKFSNDKVRVRVKEAEQN